jgi:hypothetical protein
LSEVTEFHDVLAGAARALGAPFSPGTVRPILETYADCIPRSVISLRVASGTRRAGELDCRFATMDRDVDPYGQALAGGLLPRTDHPVGSVLAELAARFPVDSYGIDFGMSTGFAKTWLFFPPDRMQAVGDLAALGSMPASVGGHADLLERIGLAGRATLIGIDYPDRTVNIYLGEVPAELLTEAGVRSLIGELGLPAPSRPMLELAARAFGIYLTLGWDSPGVQRLTYALTTTDPLGLTNRPDPAIERLVTSAPYRGDAAGRKFIYAGSIGPSGEYFKIQAFYQWAPRIADLMLVSGGAVGDLA